jgi:hypothetical protein
LNRLGPECEQTNGLSRDTGGQYCHYIKRYIQLYLQSTLLSYVLFTFF